MSHGIIVCEGCGTVLTSCRCMGPHERIPRGYCQACGGMNKPSTPLPEAPQGGEAAKKQPAVMSARGRMHILKCHPGPYAALAQGSKTFEWRKFDRDFQVGDVLTLHYFDPESGEFGEGSLQRRVTYIISEGFGIPPGYCIMGIQGLNAPGEVGRPATNPSAEALIDTYGIAKAELAVEVWKDSGKPIIQEWRDKVRTARAALLSAIPPAPARFRVSIGDHHAEIVVSQNASPEYHKGMVEVALAEVVRRAAIPPVIPAPAKEARVGLLLILRSLLYTDTGPIGVAKEWIKSALDASHRSPVIPENSPAPHIVGPDGKGSATGANGLFRVPDPVTAMLDAASNDGPYWLDKCIELTDKLAARRKRIEELEAEVKKLSQPPAPTTREPERAPTQEKK